MDRFQIEAMRVAAGELKLDELWSSEAAVPERISFETDFSPQKAGALQVGQEMLFVYQQKRYIFKVMDTRMVSMGRKKVTAEFVREQEGEADGSRSGS